MLDLPGISSAYRELLIKDNHGAPGTIYLLVFDEDDLRSPLIEDRGVKVAFGGIDELLHEMATVVAPDTNPPSEVTDLLPLSIVSTVLDVSSERQHDANTMRMFNGAAARYADIEAGVTFERHRFQSALEEVTETRNSIAIIGAAGVGNTTLARQLGHSLCLDGYPVWEQKAEFPFQHQPWLTVERQLGAQGRRGFLILDECTHYLRQTNLLIDHLAESDDPALRVIMTANSAQWAPRLKSRNIYKYGLDIHLSRLEDSEIYSLLNLADHNTDVARLVHDQFRSMNRNRQFNQLRRKARVRTH